MSLAEDKPRAQYDLYETDGFAWAEHQVDLLRKRRFADIDLHNIIEEIETLGRSERRSIVSSYRLIQMHPLKWEYQPERRSRSWNITINRERGTLAIDEARNPSLTRNPQPQIVEAYRQARADAADKTGLPVASLPSDCPYTPEQLRDRDFLPE